MPLWTPKVASQPLKMALKRPKMAQSGAQDWSKNHQKHKGKPTFLQNSRVWPTSLALGSLFGFNMASETCSVPPKMT